MAQQPALGCMKAIELTRKELEVDSKSPNNDSGSESRDIVDDSTLPTLPRPLRSHLPERRESGSTIEDSPGPSPSSSPNPSSPSSAITPSLYTIDSFTRFNVASVRRSSVLSRLKSSVSTTSTSTHVSRRPTVLPADFQTRPEQPEKRFIDAIGIVIPGVCDRNQCAHPRAHFVSMFRLCEPIEYTTALADHGITYTDYCRLVTALLNFLNEIAFESKGRKSDAGSGFVDSDDEDAASEAGGNVGMPSLAPQKSTLFGTTEQLEKARQHATTLNKLLKEITWNLQARGLPVMISVNSFSLFAPHRISEAHIQVLHVTLDQIFQMTLAPEATSEAIRTDAQVEKRISFVDPSLLAGFEERPSQPQLERRTVSATTTTKTPTKGDRYAQKYQLKLRQVQTRDRSRPTPLWPNAIPSRNRQVMSANAEKYGMDPYFRAWMRANINSRTRSNTYAKYMIEQEDNPSINKRLTYTEVAARGCLILDVLRKRSPSAVNRARYEHNRKLECRKTVEYGARLRMVRFGFRHSIHPPHTPEMDALGLTKEGYETILSKIDAIHTHAQPGNKLLISYLLTSLNKIRRRSTEDALTKASEYIRELNASQRRIVWTIEKLPGVYDRGLARDRTEWEISAWNGEDPLALLIQLERWGIVEKGLGVEDED